MGPRLFGKLDIRGFYSQRYPRVTATVKVRERYRPQFWRLATTHSFCKILSVRAQEEDLVIAFNILSTYIDNAVMDKSHIRAAYNSWAYKIRYGLIEK